MNLQQQFEKWLKEDYFPEADIAKKGDTYTNSTTRLMWVGWQGCHKHFTALKREREGREFP